MIKKEIINQSSEIAKNIINQLGLQSLQGVPWKINKEIVPIIDVSSQEPIKLNILKSIDTVSHGTTTIYSVPASSTKQKFFLYGFNFDYFSDAVNTDTSRTVYIYVNGQQTVLYRAVKPTLTYVKDSLNCILPRPIEIDAGTNIILNQTVAGGGSAETCVTIYGSLIQT
jgi:hypothetical protein